MLYYKAEKTILCAAQRPCMLACQKRLRFVLPRSCGPWRQIGAYRTAFEASLMSRILVLERLVTSSLAWRVGICIQRDA
jgi:hypothetical protein